MDIPVLFRGELLLVSGFQVVRPILSWHIGSVIAEKSRTFCGILPAGPAKSLTGNVAMLYLEVQDTS